MYTDPSGRQFHGGKQILCPTRAGTQDMATALGSCLRTHAGPICHLLSPSCSLLAGFSELIPHSLQAFTIGLFHAHSLPRAQAPSRTSKFKDTPQLLSQRLLSSACGCIFRLEAPSSCLKFCWLSYFSCCLSIHPHNLPAAQLPGKPWLGVPLLALSSQDDDNGAI